MLFSEDVTGFVLTTSGDQRLADRLQRVRCALECDGDRRVGTCPRVGARQQRCRHRRQRQHNVGGPVAHRGRTGPAGPMTASSELRAGVVETSDGRFVAVVRCGGTVLCTSDPFVSKDDAERAAAALLDAEKKRQADKTLQMDQAADRLKRSLERESGTQGQIGNSAERDNGLGPLGF